MEDETFGQWLRRQRRVRDLTQEELAVRMGCSDETIRKVEADRRRPSRQMVLMLYSSFGAPLHEWPNVIQLTRPGPVEDNLPELGRPLDG